MLNNRIENLAKVACTAAGAIWGLYWIPLRAVNAAGVNGSWATTLFYLVPLVLLLPIAAIRWRRIMSAGWPLQFIAIPAALALVLYSNAFLYTDVIRAILLYYLTPIWSALLARAWLKEPITRSRIVAIGLGILGLFVILNADQGMPIPKNAGDWMGLISGLFWALAANVMRRESAQNTFDVLVTWFFLGCCVWAGLSTIANTGPTKNPGWCSGYRDPSMVYSGCTVPDYSRVLRHRLGRPVVKSRHCRDFVYDRNQCRGD